MGLPARRLSETRSARGSHLRVVKTQARAPKRRRQTADAVALTYFRLFAVVVVCVAAAGLGRVWLSARAAQLSRESAILRESIRTERYEGDMLEVRESALGSPSRIRTIASETMGMKPAGAVTYLDISAASEKKHAAQKDGTARKSGATQKKSAMKPGARVATAAVSSGTSTLQKLMDLTAGEAQVLLVGDVALASTRK